MTGIVARLIADKGFGFIQAGATDFFFHRDDFQDDWNTLVYDYNANEKVRVEFEAGKGPKGPRASRVIRLDKDETTLGDA